MTAIPAPPEGYRRQPACANCINFVNHVDAWFCKLGKGDEPDIDSTEWDSWSQSLPYVEPHGTCHSYVLAPEPNEWNQPGLLGAQEIHTPKP